MASLSGVGAQFNKIKGLAQSVASAGNAAAAAVIQSNSESIANVQFPSNPLPPGISI
jgi:hypothetical protein